MTHKDQALTDRQTGKKERQTNIELLRIVSMVMIVFHHFAVHGGFNWDTATVTIPHLWYNLIVMGGKIGVDVFVLISGYFLITSHGSLFDFKRILKFWGQIIFYSLGIYGLSLLFHIQNYGMKIVVFPITFSSWWFASTYFVLYLIHPFLNMFLNALSKKTYQTLLVVLVIMWSIIPTFTMQSFESNSLCWFVTIYAIAGYARLYGFNPKITTKGYFAMWAVFTALTYLSSLVFTLLATKRSAFSGYITYFYGMEKISVLLISLTLFMAFATLKMDYHKWINILATAAFGVYLIHDSNIIRPYLWLNLFQNYQYQDSLLLIPYSIIVVLLVYVVCTAIDLIRKKVFEKPYVHIVNKYADKVLKPFEKICDLCRKLVFG